MKTDRELMNDYWAAQAQFGPLDVGPDEYLRMFDEDKARDRAYQEDMRRG